MPHTCHAAEYCQPCADRAAAGYRRMIRAAAKAVLDGSDRADKLAQRAYRLARGRAHDALSHGDRGPLIDYLARSV